MQIFFSLGREALTFLVQSALGRCCFLAGGLRLSPWLALELLLLSGVLQHDEGFFPLGGRSRGV